ncbi:MAG: twin-arginine translocation signal domain-containing protein, partial [Runella zeae]
MKASFLTNRRQFLKHSSLLATAMASTPYWASASQEGGYKIAVVDLMILKRQKLGAFQLTKDIGADGL